MTQSGFHDFEAEKIDSLVQLLGLSSSHGSGATQPGGIELLIDLARQESDAARHLGDERQARILEKTVQWLKTLEAQSALLTEVTSRLYDRCKQNSAIIKTGLFAQPRKEIIEKLEWALAGMEQWVEGTMPQDDSEADEKRFYVLWREGQDPLGGWSPKADENDSLLGVVQDCVEVDGGFSGAAAPLLAQQILADIRAGLLDIPRLRRCPESTSEVDVFKLMPRGTYADEEVNTSEDAVLTPHLGEGTEPVPAMLEAEAADILPELEEYLDSAICETAVAEYRYVQVTTEVPAISRSQVHRDLGEVLGSSLWENLGEQRDQLRGLVESIGKRRNVAPDRILSLLCQLASFRLQSARYARDVDAMDRYLASLVRVTALIGEH